MIILSLNFLLVNKVVWILFWWFRFRVKVYFEGVNLRVGFFLGSLGYSCGFRGVLSFVIIFVYVFLLN